SCAMIMSSRLNRSSGSSWLVSISLRSAIQVSSQVHTHLSFVLGIAGQHRSQHGLGLLVVHVAYGGHALLVDLVHQHGVAGVAEGFKRNGDNLAELSQYNLLLGGRGTHCRVSLVSASSSMAAAVKTSTVAWVGMVLSSPLVPGRSLRCHSRTKCPEKPCFFS